jgi:hypothetical protein
VWRRKSSEKQLPQPSPAPARRQPSPGADLYTVLLGIALIAVLVAILFVCLHMGVYEFKLKG